MWNLKKQPLAATCSHSSGRKWPQVAARASGRKWPQVAAWTENTSPNGPTLENLKIKGPDNPTCQLLPTSSTRKVKMACGKQEREKRWWRIGVEQVVCGRVSTSKLRMDKLCCMHVCMYGCMYECMDGCMDGCMDAYIYIYMCVYLCMFVW